MESREMSNSLDQVYGRRAIPLGAQGRRLIPRFSGFLVP